MSSSASSRPTAAPKTAEQIGDLEIMPAQPIEYRGTTFEEMDVDAVLARQPRGRARRRARAHERARLAQREALAGRRGAARRRHRRDLDAQHPAPRVAERRRRADHRRQAARDDPRRGRAPRRPDRARRHDARGAPAPAWRTATSTRAERIDAALANYFRPGQPRGAARARAALGRRPRRRGARRLPRAPRHRRSRGRRASGASSR